MDQPADPDNIRFNVLRNALYHTARRRHFEQLSRWLNFAVVVLGTATAASFASIAAAGGAVLGGASAVIGALQLTFDHAGRAREHQILQREYYRLLARIEALAEPTAENIAEWRSEMLLITADEPPTMRAIDAKAYNDAIGATEIYPNSERLHIPAKVSFLGRWFSFDGYDFKKLRELEQAPDLSSDGVGESDRAH